MLAVKILLGIIALPFMLLAYLLHYFFKLAVLIGTRFVIIVSGLVIIGGLIVILIEKCSEPSVPGDKGNAATGVWMLLGGIVGCFLPYLAAFLSDLFRYIAEWIKFKAYNR